MERIEYLLLVNFALFFAHSYFLLPPDRESNQKDLVRTLMLSLGPYSLTFGNGNLTVYQINSVQIQKDQLLKLFLNLLANPFLFDTQLISRML